MKIRKDREKLKVFNQFDLSNIVEHYTKQLKNEHYEFLGNIHQDMYWPILKAKTQTLHFILCGNKKNSGIFRKKQIYTQLVDQGRNHKVY